MNNTPPTPAAAEKCPYDNCVNGELICHEGGRSYREPCDWPGHASHTPAAAEEVERGYLIPAIHRIRRGEPATESELRGAFAFADDLVQGLRRERELSASRLHRVEEALRRTAERLHGLTDDPMHARHVFSRCDHPDCRAARAALAEQSSPPEDITAMRDPNPPPAE